MLQLMGPEDKLLVTGGTGLVGSQVIQRARTAGVPTIALVRSASQAEFFEVARRRSGRSRSHSEKNAGRRSPRRDDCRTHCCKSR